MVGTRLDPNAIGQALRQMAGVLGALLAAVPESLQGTLVAATSGLVLLIIGSASVKARSDAGGAIFVGVTVLSTFGFAATASSGTIGCRWATIVFAVLPMVSVFAVVGVGIASRGHSQGSALYWLSWTARRAGIAWVVWAFGVTPSLVRIPLWSSVGWAGLVLALVFFNPVSAIFGLAMGATVVGNVLMVVLGWPRRVRPAMTPAARPDA